MCCKYSLFSEKGGLIKIGVLNRNVLFLIFTATLNRYNTMKHILTALLTLCCFAVGLHAQNNSDKPVLFEIVAQGDISTPIYCSALE